jgi:hypothetical protein
MNMTSTAAATSTDMAISGAMTTSAMTTASMAAGAAVDVPALGGILGGIIVLIGLL